MITSLALCVFLYKIRGKFFFRSNMQIGVKAGMVRSIESCKAGFEAFKQQFKNTSKDKEPNGVLNEWFV